MIYRYKWEIKLWIAAIAYIIWVVTSAVVHGDDTVNICFDTPELMAKFLEQNPVGAFNITVPCPPFNPSHEEDESGR